jgi:hypothetical protein
MPEYLEMLDLRSLTILSIGSEAVNNKSVKNLVKMNMPALKHINFNNTSITSDDIRTIGKLPNILHSIGSTDEGNFETVSYFKRAISLMEIQSFANLMVVQR